MLETVWEKETLLHCWWEGKLMQSLWRRVRKFLKKLKTELSYDPAILGMYLEENSNASSTTHPSVHIAKA